MGGSEEEVRYILVSSITVPLQLGIAVYSILAFDIAWISYVLGVGGGRRCRNRAAGRWQRWASQLLDQTLLTIRAQVNTSHGGSWFSAFTGERH